MYLCKKQNKMKNLLLILLIALFVSCNKDDVDLNANCWVVVQVFGWTKLPSGTRVVEITIEKDGVKRVLRKKGYKIGDYYCY